MQKKKYIINKIFRILIYIIIFLELSLNIKAENYNKDKILYYYLEISSNVKNIDKTKIDFQNLKILIKNNSEHDKDYCIKYENDFDNNGKMDLIKASGKWLKIKINEKEYLDKNSYLNSNITSIGMNDLNNDGYLDIWFNDSGDNELNIYYGDGKGNIKDKQEIVIPRIEKNSFYDVDNDGILDIIYTDNKEMNYFWIKVYLKEKSRNHFVNKVVLYFIITIIGLFVLILLIIKIIFNKENKR